MTEGEITIFISTLFVPSAGGLLWLSYSRPALFERVLVVVTTWVLVLTAAIVGAYLGIYRGSTEMRALAVTASAAVDQQLPKSLNFGYSALMLAFWGGLTAVVMILSILIWLERKPPSRAKGRPRAKTPEQ